MNKRGKKEDYSFSEEEEEEKMISGILPTANKEKRSKSRRHSFSFFKFPEMKTKETGKKQKSKKKRPERRKSFSKKGPNKLLPPDFLVDNPKITKSAETILAENILNLVSLYPVFVRKISDFTFHQQIGVGGFGEVWLANDLRSGKVVAVKELYAHTLIGRPLQCFIREIVTMAHTNNNFVLPFVGFTIEKPYCIITEYMPNGSLGSYLKREYALKKPIFTGTHLTMIAIGIIDALKHLHSLPIIHRDVKPVNVILDHRFMPKLCDFGVSRFLAKGRAMTDGIGTASHMAPELISSNFYNTKVDIFAYGITLFEMLEKRKAFKGNMKEVIQKIKSGQRPNFVRKNNPPGLVELIQKCWDANPDKRPSAVQVYKKFKDGSAYFDGTDPEVIKKFVAKIDKERAERKANGTLKTPRVPKYWTGVNIPSVKEKLQRDVEYWKFQDQIKLSLNLPILETIDPTGGKFVRTEEEKAEYLRKKGSVIKEQLTEFKASVPSLQAVGGNLYDILSNPKDPKFFQIVPEVCAIISPEQFPPVYSCLVKLLFESQDVVDNSLRVFIINNFKCIIERDREFIDVFEKYHFFNNIPTNNIELCEASIQFIAIVFIRSPNSIKSTMFRPLGSLLKQMPDQTIALFYKYIDRYTRIKQPFVVLDFLLRYARAFIHIPAGVAYVNIVYHLLLIQEYAESRRDTLMKIVSAFCRSHNTDVALQSIKVFTSVFINGIDPVPFDAIIKLVGNSHCIDAVISLLLRTEKYPVSKTFFRALAEKSTSKPKLSRVLLKFAGQQKETAHIASLTTKWMNNANSASYKLMLILFANEETRPRIVFSKYFPQFLSKALKSCTQEVLLSLGTVLRRIVLSQQFIDRLDDASFFNYLLDIMKNMDHSNQPLMHGAFIILDTLIKAGFSSNYRHYLEFLAGFLKESTQNTKQAALIFVSLSSHSRMAKHFKTNHALVSYFTKLQSSHSMSNAAKVFLSNIKSV